MPSSRAISSASSWSAAALARPSGARRASSGVRVVGGGPRVLGPVAGALAEREAVLEVAERGVDPTRGGREQPEQPVEGQRNEEARRAPLGRERVVEPRRGVGVARAARRSAQARPRHRSPAAGIEPRQREHARGRRSGDVQPLVAARDANGERDREGEEDVVGDRPRRRRRQRPRPAAGRGTRRPRRRRPSWYSSTAPKRKVAGVARIRGQADSLISRAVDQSPS